MFLKGHAREHFVQDNKNISTKIYQPKIYKPKKIKISDILSDVILFTGGSQGLSSKFFFAVLNHFF